MTMAPTPTERSTGWSDAWLDLVPMPPGHRVLIVTGAPGPALGRLAGRAGSLSVAVTHAASGPLALAQVDGAPIDVEVGSLDSLLPPDRELDIVILQGTVRAVALDQVARHLAPSGRLVILTDNAMSPLRAVDRLRGRPSGATGGSHRKLVRRLRHAGLASMSTFALLRSSSSPVVAFRTDRHEVARSVLTAATSLVGGGRGWALRALRAGAGIGRATGLVPAWLIVARRPAAAPDDPLTPSGRIGVEENDQGVVVLGAGPDGVEKWFRNREDADRVEAALATLAAAGFALAPQVIDRPDPCRLRLTWVAGGGLDALTMPPRRLVAWTAAGAEVLARIQRLTADGNGQVLVHGDYWLGCLVVDRGQVAGVVDWTDSYRGDPAVDLDELVSVAASRPGLDPERRQEIVTAALRAHRAAGGPAAARRHLEAAR